MKNHAFTILEMLLATTLSAGLLLIVLSVSAALARDARQLQARFDFTHADNAFNLLRWDLHNASSIATARDARSLVLTGHGGIDRQTMRPTGRLTRVEYSITSAGLVRTQRYLDDAARPQPWTELVHADAIGIEAIPSTATVRLRIGMLNGKWIEQAILVK